MLLKQTEQLNSIKKQYRKAIHIGKKYVVDYENTTDEQLLLTQKDYSGGEEQAHRIQEVAQLKNVVRAGAKQWHLNVIIRLEWACLK